MSDCCDPVPYRRFFNRKEAERNVRAYRRRGLDPMASSMVEYLKSQGVEGADVLEVGGGVGAIQIELLKAGAESSVNIELSAGYEDAARDLAAANGFQERMTRRLGDFVAEQDKIAQADIVVMNRVVCCYPWMERLMSAAVKKTGSRLAIVFPREKWWVKLGIRIGNGFMSLRKCSFQAYVHPVKEIEAVATNAGFAVRHVDNTFIWQALVLERSA
jgi:cyclopropane fatty-acyl-phospholipid synthase-like methyltransferase